MLVTYHEKTTSILGLQLYGFCLPPHSKAGFHWAFISDRLLTAQRGVTDVFLSGGRFSKGRVWQTNDEAKGNLSRPDMISNNQTVPVLASPRYSPFQLLGLIIHRGGDDADDNVGALLITLISTAVALVVITVYRVSTHPFIHSITRHQTFSSEAHQPIPI